MPARHREAGSALLYVVRRCEAIVLDSIENKLCATGRDPVNGLALVHVIEGKILPSGERAAVHGLATGDSSKSSPGSGEGILSI